jgi:hypothetical protein
MPTQQQPTPGTNQPQVDPTALALSRAIRSAEGGDYNNTTGDAGTSKGAYQWQPGHFEAAAKAQGLDPNDFSPTNQDHVAYNQVKEQLDAGHSQSQVASWWNSGRYDSTGNVGDKTINGKVIHYDTPAYVEKVKQAYLQASQVQTNSPASSLTPPTPPGQAQTQQSTQGAFGGALQPPTPPKTTAQTPGADTTTQETFTGDLASGNYGGAALKGAENVGNFLFPIAGDLYNDATGKNTKTDLQQAADAGLSALTLIPGLGEVGKGAEAATLAAKEAPSLLGLAGKGAAYGAGAGALSSVGQGNTDIGSIARDTAVGGVTGGVTGGLLGRLGGGADALNKSATEDITKVLAPTGKTDKLITQKIAPQLAKSGVMAATREGLLSKYQALQGAAGDALEAGYDKLPPDAKVEVGGLFDTIQKKIDALTINGSVPSAAQSKVTALQGMMKDLANIGIETSADGSKVFADVGNVRQLRQILDNTISKNFGLTELDGATKSAQKTLANSIRGAFAQQYPDIAKLNKDFSFWSDATKVLQNTIDRKTGQTGLLRKGISGGIGAMGGMMSGHPIIGAGIGKILSDFVESPAFHTVSAALKNKIATAFEKGDYVGAGKLMQGLIKTSPTLVGRGTAGLLNQI